MSIKTLLAYDHLARTTARLLASKWGLGSQEYADILQMARLGMQEAIETSARCSGSFQNYAIGIMRNHIYEGLKIRGGGEWLQIPINADDEPKIGHDAFAFENPVEEEVLAALAYERVALAMKRLSEIECQVIDAHYFGGLAKTQIGAELGLSEASIRQLHTQALIRLRLWLYDSAELFEEDGDV